MARVKIGWAEIDITPDKKVSLAGQFAERISEYVEKPLTVTAMAVECGNDQMVLVGCDLEVVETYLAADLRKRLKDNQEGLDPSKVIFNAIHTHTGPGYSNSADAVKWAKEWYFNMKPYLQEDQEYVEHESVTDNPEVATDYDIYLMLLDRIPKVVLSAWRNRKPASFRNGFERAAVGFCRRAAYSDDTAQMWGDTNTAVFSEMEGGNDSGVEILFTFDENKIVTGALVNVCSPAQCVQHRKFVSPDYWGEAKMLLRKHFGKDFFVLPTCSTAGDQCPVDLVRWVNPETDANDPNLIRHNPPVRKADPSMFDLSGMRRAGRRVANAVADAFEELSGDFQEDIPFIHHVHNMLLPLRRVTLTERNNAIKGLKEYCRGIPGNVNFMDVARCQQYFGVTDRFELQEKQNTVDSEVHIIRMGSIAIATYPYEVFLDYGNQIKARQFCEQSFLIQLANGSQGYLPTEKAERHGHYSGFVGSGTVGHEGGDLLVRETLKDINEMFENDYKTYE